MLLLNRRGNSGGTRLPLHLGRCQNGWHAHKRVNIAVGGGGQAIQRWRAVSYCVWSF